MNKYIHWLFEKWAFYSFDHARHLIHRHEITVLCSPALVLYKDGFVHFSCDIFWVCFVIFSWVVLKAEFLVANPI